MAWQTQLMHQVPTICRDVVEVLPNLRRTRKLSNLEQFQNTMRSSIRAQAQNNDANGTSQYDVRLAPYMDRFALMTEATWRNVLLYA